MKLNENGFAISTILYGILLVGIMVMALLMSTASFNQKTTKDFVNTVEKELNSTAESFMPGGDGRSINASNDVFKAGKTGYYKITVCQGRCASGVIYLFVRQRLYFTGGSVRYGKNTSENEIMNVNNFISGMPRTTSSSYDAQTKAEDFTLHSSGKYFLNPQFINGSSSSVNFLNIIDINNASYRDQNYNGVRFIRLCNGGKNWSEIQVISKGRNVAYYKPVVSDLGTYNGKNFKYLTDNRTDTSETLSNTKCIYLDIGVDMTNGGVPYDIDVIGVYGSNSEVSVAKAPQDGVTFNIVDLNYIPLSSVTNVSGPTIYHAYRGL